ncbi:hypothetical protein FA15DRAFT_705528 [Coprinopsis marcescibilis]|uniref:Uncharacterized protein n=1 Tax=Coprinopsis marcescibilis TaxID=230819 RepID=A0A5C3KS68_COPMA|nr:hypothetical protein FA15DRAFT_705528 [Coprinopsis marcescibilis]
MGYSAQGNILCLEGNLFYSPNCTRKVDLPEPINKNSDRNPFQIGTTWEDLRNPCRWTRAYGWRAFIPIDRHFDVYPLSCAAYIPAPVLNPENDLYSLPSSVVHNWNELDRTIGVITAILSREFDTPTVAPYPVRGWGYHRLFKSLAKARAISHRARDWFIVWMGLLSFMIAYAERKCNEFRAFQHTYGEGVVDVELKWWQDVLAKATGIQYMVDALPCSVVCSFTPATQRCGIFLDLVQKEEFQLPVDWFIGCGVPVWFPWNTDTAKHLEFNDMQHLIPPSHLLQMQHTLPPPNRPPSSAAPSEETEMLRRIEKRRILANEASKKCQDVILATIEDLTRKSERKREKDTPIEREKANQRMKKPPTTSALVCEYAVDEDPNKLRMELAPRAMREDILGQYTNDQKRYFPHLNLWICCFDLAPEQYVPDDEGDGTEYDVNNDMNPLPSEPAPFPAPPITPANNQLSPEFSDGFGGTNGAARFEETLVKSMRQFYGFIAPIPYPVTPSLPLDAPSIPKSALLVLGFPSTLNSTFCNAPISTSVVEFCHQLAKKKATPISWDLLPETIAPPPSAHLVANLIVKPRQIIPPKSNIVDSQHATMKSDDSKPVWFVIDFGENCPWKIAVTRAIDFLPICRLGSAPNVKTIVPFLLEHGIRFQTFTSRLPVRECFYRPVPTRLPARFHGHQFTFQEYQAYEYHRNLLLSDRRRMRAALLRGGIVWRLAFHSDVVQETLDDPTGAHDVTLEINGAEHHDDALTTVEEFLIVGAYSCPTGYGDQRSVRSWWPLPTTFDNSEYTGRWTHRQEAWFSERFGAICNGKGRPFAVKEWRDLLKGYKSKTQILSDRLEESSREFIDRQRNLHSV